MKYKVWDNLSRIEFLQDEIKIGFDIEYDYYGCSERSFTIEINLIKIQIILGVFKRKRRRE